MEMYIYFIEFRTIIMEESLDSTQDEIIGSILTLSLTSTKEDINESTISFFVCTKIVYIIIGIQ